MRDMWPLLAATFRDWYEDRAQRLGAALAYYTIFALTPGLVLVIALAGVLLGQDAEGQILGQIRELIGEQGAAAIEATTRSARTRDSGGRGDRAGALSCWCSGYGDSSVSFRMGSTRSGG